jgi:hypothetical protein
MCTRTPSGNVPSRHFAPCVEPSTAGRQAACGVSPVIAVGVHRWIGSSEPLDGPVISLPGKFATIMATDAPWRVDSPKCRRGISSCAWQRPLLEDKPLAASPRLSRGCTPMDWERRTIGRGRLRVCVSFPGTARDDAIARWERALFSFCESTELELELEHWLPAFQTRRVIYVIIRQPVSRSHLCDGPVVNGLPPTVAALIAVSTADALPDISNTQSKSSVGTDATIWVAPNSTPR